MAVTAFSAASEPDLITPLQEEVARKLNTLDAPAAVRATALTGLSTATATPVVPTDTVLVGAGKLQAQINEVRRSKMLPVTGRFYSSCNVGSAFSSGTVAANQRRTVIYEPLSDMTVNQIGIVLASIPAEAGFAMLAVYEFSAANPAQLNLLHNFGQITVDATVGAKIVTANFTFRFGRVYALVLHVSRAFVLATAPQTTQTAIGLSAADGTQNTFWFLPVNYDGTVAPTIDTSVQNTAGSASVLIVMRAA